MRQCLSSFVVFLPLEENLRGQIVSSYRALIFLFQAGSNVSSHAEQNDETRTTPGNYL